MCVCEVSFKVKVTRDNTGQQKREQKGKSTKGKVLVYRIQLRRLRRLTALLTLLVEWKVDVNRFATENTAGQVLSVFPVATHTRTLPTQEFITCKLKIERPICINSSTKSVNAGQSLSRTHTVLCTHAYTLELLKGVPHFSWYGRL